MLVTLDRWLNKLTMYKLVFYVLLSYLSIAVVLGFFGSLPFTGWQIILTSIYLVAACWFVNRVFAWAWHAPAHDDSAYITAMILALIVTPFRRSTDLPILIWAPILAMAGKYIVAWHKQHFFNPTALAVVLTGLVLHQAASWWVGTANMFWPVLIGGFLIVRKIRRFDVVTSSLAIAVGATIIFGLSRGSGLTVITRQLFVSSPLLFFSTIMLTEPSTMPPTHRWRMIYGGLVGLLTAPFIHLGSFYFTPEMALLSGNLIGWAASRRERFVLTLREKIQTGSSVVDLIFDAPRRPKFQAGQYLEWTLAHDHPDSRGVRRYFTIASSPTESGLRLGVKQYQPMSSYKQALFSLQPGQQIVAQQLDGDFVLPTDATQHLVFIAGGIGITPFRSILKFLLDRHESRPMTLFFSNQTVDDIVYADVLRQSETELQLKVIHVLSNTEKIPSDWTGERGYITAEMIQRLVPDYAAARFYLSGPQAMVTNYVRLLTSLRIPRKKIVTDYFPGFA